MESGCPLLDGPRGYSSFSQVTGSIPVQTVGVFIVVMLTLKDRGGRGLRSDPQTRSDKFYCVLVQSHDEGTDPGNVRCCSVVGLQPPDLLPQPLDLLHQRLVHRVLLHQTVDLVLRGTETDGANMLTC